MWISQKLRQVFGQAAKSTQLLAEIRAGSDNQQRLINDKLDETIGALTDVSKVLRTKLDAVIAGLDNNNRIMNSKLDAVITGLSNQTRLINEKLDALIASEARRNAGGAGASDPTEPRRSSR
jgi:hypothetical protein